MGRRHGRCGLAAGPGPRKIRGDLPRERHRRDGSAEPDAREPEGAWRHSSSVTGSSCSMPSLLCVATRASKLHPSQQRLHGHRLPQQLLRQSPKAADHAILTLPPPIPVQRSHRFTRPTTRRCRVRATHGETVLPPDLLSPRSLRLARKGRRRRWAVQKELLCIARPGKLSHPSPSARHFRLPFNGLARSELRRIFCSDEGALMRIFRGPTRRD